MQWRGWSTYSDIVAVWSCLDTEQLIMNLLLKPSRCVCLCVCVGACVHACMYVFDVYMLHAYVYVYACMCVCMCV